MPDFLQETNDVNAAYLSGEFENITKAISETGDYPFTEESDPIKQVRDIIPSLKDETVTRQTEKLLSIISAMIRLLQQNRASLKHLPPLYAYIEEDGALLIEWTFADFRAGFNIEPHAEESGWHLVSGKQIGGSAISGHFSDIKTLILYLIRFILAYN